MTCQYFFIATAAKAWTIGLETASDSGVLGAHQGAGQERGCEPQHVARVPSGARPGFVKAPNDRQGCCRSQARANLECAGTRLRCASTRPGELQLAAP